MSNFISFAASIAELGHGKNSVLNQSHSVTHPGYLMPREPKISLQNIFQLARRVAVTGILSGSFSASRHVHIMYIQFCQWMLQSTTAEGDCMHATHATCHWDHMSSTRVSNDLSNTRCLRDMDSPKWFCCGCRPMTWAYVIKLQAFCSLWTIAWRKIALSPNQSATYLILMGHDPQLLPRKRHWWINFDNREQTCFS